MQELTYTRPKDRTCDSVIVGYAAQIHKYKGKQQVLLNQSPSDLERSMEIAKTQSAEAFNKIEGIRPKRLRADKTAPRTGALYDREERRCVCVVTEEGIGSALP